jgi:hypothetical protein
MANKKLILMGSFLMIFILIIGAIAVAMLIPMGQKTATGGKEFQCRVVLDGDVFSSTDIKSASCRYVGDCPAFLYSIEPLLFGSDKGQIELVGEDGLVYAYKSYKVTNDPFTDNPDFILRGCSNIQTGEIIVMSDKGDEQDRTDVSLI